MESEAVDALIMGNTELNSDPLLEKNYQNRMQRQDEKWFILLEKSEQITLFLCV
tara:strand:- start:54 stop:215 length:162 start_codon:yes stop_codon:yes gene_type:complete